MTMTAFIECCVLITLCLIIFGMTWLIPWVFLKNDKEKQYFISWITSVAVAAIFLLALLKNTGAF